ncbi:MAG TPA: 3',5'-cyclic-nucleotide phosphodiesterase [Puia sp.]|nr:3',5'-cyclic-nucleotide phosphodiesterase [Puia sp.]
MISFKSCLKFPIFILILHSCFLNAYPQSPDRPSFKIIPLGVLGGSDESNLSSYMVAPVNSEDYICLDAGTLRSGIQKAIAAGILQGTAPAILRNNVKAYLISHPHLDHVAGLIINSPDDSAKNIYALPFCIDVLKSNYFTWRSWANFGNEGEKPTLNKYRYINLDTAKETILGNTQMTVRPFLLSHSSPYKSTAFLIKLNNSYLLYLGDTGADEMEKASNLSLLWQTVSPLIKSRKLKAIFIETSFPDEQPVRQLFGHLTPALLMKEMASLSQFTGIEALKNFPLIITHIKPTTADIEEKIKSELATKNTLQLNLIFPKQAIELRF